MREHIIRWEKAPYQRNVYVTDVPGIGRYLVKRVPRSSTWIAMRNGEPTALREDTLEAIQQSVENVIRAVVR